MMVYVRLHTITGIGVCAARDTKLQQRSVRRHVAPP